MVHLITANKQLLNFIHFSYTPKDNLFLDLVENSNILRQDKINIPTLVLGRNIYFILSQNTHLVRAKQSFYLGVKGLKEKTQTCDLPTTQT